MLCWTAALALAVKYQIVATKVENIVRFQILTSSGNRHGIYIFFGILYGLSICLFIIFNVLIVLISDWE